MGALRVTPSERTAALRAPFPPADIEWRIARVMKTKNGPMAIVLAYITARAVMGRLDEVFGVGGWQDSYERVAGDDPGFLCTLSVLWEDPDREPIWLTKSDGAPYTNIEALKGGVSDALKRAAVKFGIGRYLYGLTENWVKIDETGKFKNFGGAKYVADGKTGIKGHWVPPKLPPWAIPKDVKYDHEQPEEAKASEVEAEYEAEYEPESGMYIPKKRPQKPQKAAENGGGEERKQVDWSQFNVKYALPFKKDQVDMDGVRRKIKELGGRFRGKKNNPDPDADNCWYLKEELVNMDWAEEYKTVLKGGGGVAEILEDDDLPF